MKTVKETIITIIEENCCPLNAIGKLKEKTIGSWIILNENCVKQIKENSSKVYKDIDGINTITIHQEKTSLTPYTVISLTKFKNNLYLVKYISATDIPYKSCPEIPEKLYFIFIR